MKMGIPILLGKWGWGPYSVGNWKHGLNVKLIIIELYNVNCQGKLMNNKNDEIKELIIIQ